MIRDRECRVTGCPRSPRPGQSYCSTHRTRVWRYGDPHQSKAEPDGIAIEAAVSARRALPGMRPAERREAGLRLTRLGLPAEEIARIFDVEPRTVYRWRAQGRIAEAA
jgi:DNA-directed RNA polymerase specialized sigma24 family protein